MDGFFCFAGISSPEQPQKLYLYDHKHDKNLLFWKLKYGYDYGKNWFFWQGINLASFMLHFCLLSDM